jgi:hypothetical protein
MAQRTSDIAQARRLFVAKDDDAWERFQGRVIALRIE